MPVRSFREHRCSRIGIGLHHRIEIRILHLPGFARGMVADSARPEYHLPRQRAECLGEEVSCPLLDEWKDGEVWIRNYEDDREGNVLRPYEAVIIGAAVNIVKAG